MGILLDYCENGVNEVVGRLVGEVVCTNEWSEQHTVPRTRKCRKYLTSYNEMVFLNRKRHGQDIPYWEVTYIVFICGIILEWCQMTYYLKKESEWHFKSLSKVYIYILVS